MNHRTETHPESPEQLIKNIQKLMEEVEAVVSKSGSGSESNGLAALQDRFSTAKTKVQGYYKIARQKVLDGAEVADDTIRSHPYESLAVALGVGVLLGALLRRRD